MRLHYSRLSSRWMAAMIAISLGVLFCWTLLPAPATAAANFSESIIDRTTGNGYYKARVFDRFSDDTAADVGAAKDNHFYLYRYAEHWKAYPIFTLPAGQSSGGFEQAAAADIKNNGRKDIIIGGWGNVLAWAENPGAHCYTTPWAVHIIDNSRWNHDVYAADMNKDGKIDIVTNQGIYLQGDNHAFTFVDIGRIQDHVAVGTAIGNMLNNGDGYNDVVAAYKDGKTIRVAWYENPGHTGGNPSHGPWGVHFIDSYPGGAAANPNAEAMAFAVGDLDGDGKLDVVAAYQAEGPDKHFSQIGDGLVWYRCPTDPRSANWPKTVINAQLSYIHTASLKLADFTGDGHLDICYAQQEQSGPTPMDQGDPTEPIKQQMGIYYNNGAGQHWTLRILSKQGDYASGGFNSVLGKVGDDTLPSILTANHGYCGFANPLELWRNLGPARR